MKIRILTATTEKESKQGCHLSQEDLKQLADTKGCTPVTWCFDTRQTLGQVVNKEITPSGLVTTVEIAERLLSLILEIKVYLVPGYLDMKGKLSLVEVAFTLNPVDLTLPHIETHHIVD